MKRAYEDRALRAGVAPVAPTVEPPKVDAVAPAGLLQVKQGRSLLWPDGVHRGDQGYVVRADDPFVQDRRPLLRQADAGRHPAPLADWPRHWQMAAHRLGFDPSETSA